MLNVMFISISFENQLKRVQYLDHGESLIGRDSSCHIRLTENHISRKHAVIRIQCDKISIEDLKSRNGTSVNGQLIVSEFLLGEGDEIQIGSHRLCLYRAVPAVDPPDSDAEMSTMGPPGKFAPRDCGPNEVPTLSPAQQRILTGFLEGHSEKQIAAMLQLSKHTVHTHAKAIYRAYSVSTRSELLLRHISLHGREIPTPQKELDCDR